MVDAVDNRRNSFEFVGYDFMVDDEFNVWLLEVNKSPTLKQSTHVTEPIVK